MGNKNHKQLLFDEVEKVKEVESIIMNRIHKRFKEQVKGKIIIISVGTERITKSGNEWYNKLKNE